MGVLRRLKRHTSTSLTHLLVCADHGNIDIIITKCVPLVNIWYDTTTQLENVNRKKEVAVVEHVFWLQGQTHLKRRLCTVIQRIGDVLLNNGNISGIPDIRTHFHSKVIVLTHLERGYCICWLSTRIYIALCKPSLK